jgi:hypothetical protein
MQEAPMFLMMHDGALSRIYCCMLRVREAANHALIGFDRAQIISPNHHADLDQSIGYAKKLKKLC